jgi:cyclic beta-1,2-glucan synthetase
VIWAYTLLGDGAQAGALLDLTDWPGYQVWYCYGQTRYHIQVVNPHSVATGVINVIIDGEAATDGRIFLNDDGVEHTVQVTLGS